MRYANSGPPRNSTTSSNSYRLRSAGYANTSTRTPIISNRLKAIFRKLYRFYGPQHWWPADTAFEMMAGAILTQNTAWSNVEKAIGNLRRAGMLNPARMRGLTKTRLARLIRPAGYYNVKAKRLKHLVAFLFLEYGGDIRMMAKEPTAVLCHKLLGVNGVGPETCDSILLYAFNRPVFVADAYTKRVFSRHSLLRKDASYHDVQRLFMDNLPPAAKMFNEYHALIVRLAKDFCAATPRCAGCPLNSLANAGSG